jgi:lipopolysaccharide export system protein LptA
MAATPLKHSRVLLVAGAVLLAAGTASGAPGPPRISMQRGTISVDADSTSIDYKAHHVTLKKVVISQGDLRVTADRAEASGIDFDNSRWIFTSNVHITSEQLGVLRSDSATVEFRNDRLESALVTGNPAEFEQTTSKTGVFARGHADSIEYKVATDTVRLTGNAQLLYGGTETTAPVVVYNVRDQRLQFAGAAQPGGRVHIVTTPSKPGKPVTVPKAPGRARGAAPPSASGPP